ncbi:MAG: acyltransferase [Planctomycetota bacterium]
MSSAEAELSRPSYPRHLAGADGVRALACLLVVAVHVYDVTPDPTNAVDAAVKWAVKWEKLGVGVGAFFVLSGMLLSYPFWMAFAGGRALPSMKRYTSRRVVRIVPAFTVVSLVCFAAFSPWGPAEFGRLVAGLLYVNSYHYQTYFPVEGDTPLWSIGVEMQFYLLLALTMVGLFAWRRVSRGMLAAAGVIAGLAAAIALGNWWIGQTVFDPMLADVRANWMQLGHPGLAAEHYLPYKNPAGLFAYFLVGVLSGWGIVWLVWTGRTATWGGRRWLGFNAFDGAIVGTGVAFLPLAVLLPDGWDLGLGHGFPVFPACMAVVMACLPFTGRIGAWLDNGLLRWVGLVSYGLYLWHFPVLLWVKKFWPTDLEGVESIGVFERFAFGVLVLGIATALAAVSWYAIEQPVVRWAKRLEGGSAKPVPADRGPK